MVDDPDVGDPTRAVAGAKVLADDAATANGRSAVQVHGGMGFTWEVPVHFFVKRAWLHATEFGTAHEHAEDLAQLL
jgi:alkylation response protein AidB-like acyl-CoA dehydrogenase